MHNKLYTPSVNIIRDIDRELNYYVTPNANNVVGQIVNEFKRGLRSFTIIGSYGTGKSSLIWALEQSLTKKERFFDVSFIDNANIKIVNIIGEYRSIIDVFAEAFNVKEKENTPQHILSEIYNSYYDLGPSNQFLCIVIDEFGKFLEYAAKNTPEKELYFVQQLSEFINNSNYNICLITTVHQNFDAYSNELSRLQRHEWAKVKGRFIEITFNEPIEQLLFLAAEHLESHLKTDFARDMLKGFEIAFNSKVFRFDKQIVESIAYKLFPMDLIAAHALTITLQRYGQNDRSLFSFLETTDYSGINRFQPDVNNPFYSIPQIYDYLIQNFYSIINSKYNQDFIAWAGIRASLEKIEHYFDEEESLKDYEKIVKTIGVLAITIPKGINILDDFLNEYARVCLGVNNISVLIQNLVNRKIIIKRLYSSRYALLDGTDLDIHTAIYEAGNKLSVITDIVSILEKHYSLSPVMAKMESYLIGTPRLFEFAISEFPINKEAQDEIDGFINLLFNEDLLINEIISHSKNNKEAIIYGYYNNTRKIKDQLFEIEKTQKVILENAEDKVAIRELENILKNHKSLLNHFILDSFYSGTVTWIFDGREVIIKSKKDFNKLLSLVCRTVYKSCPEFKNELVNRHKVTGQIHGARKEFLKQICNNWTLPDIGFEKDKFPPHKTIYLSLIKENEIQLALTDANISDNSKFKTLWDFCEEFLRKSKYTKLGVSELFSELGRKPFKLKRGLIEFWVPTFLFIKRHEYALFGNDKFILDINEDVLELMARVPENYEIKAFNLENFRAELFSSYRILLDQSTDVKFDKSAFIQTLKPFFSFYSNLNEYIKNTKNLSKQAILLREAIIKSKDPEKTFFEDFPVALGYSLDSLQKSESALQDYVKLLRKVLQEIRTTFERLINRIEKFILNEFIGEELPFEAYKTRLQNRFVSLHKHLLMTNQKSFIQRIDAPIDNKTMWIDSIGQVLTGKNLSSFRDEDEIHFYDKLKKMVSDLDNLNNLSKIEINTEEESLISLEIGSFIDGINKSLVRFPKSKEPMVTVLEKVIKEQLSEDKEMNIIVLTNLLKDLIKK